ncbi:MAG: protein kinase [Acidobacteriota bacterium]
MTKDPGPSAVRELFDLAVGLAGPERERLLADASVESPEVAKEVIGLLEEVGGRDSFLDSFPSCLGVSSGDETSTERSMLAAGEVLAARFRIVRYLARGGMGEVYEAEDLLLGGVVALKTIRPEMAGNARAMRRLHREVAVARRVTHPAVCRIFDVGHHVRDGLRLSFLTMELLEGEPLGRRLRRDGPLPIPEAQMVAHDVGQGLSALHEAGVLHRDLKSDNVFLMAGLRRARGACAVVTDFGLARAAGDRDGSSEDERFAGTLDTMSPEQVRGDPLTAASDVYSFGLLLHEMVTGALPFEGDTGVARALRRLSEHPVSPLLARPDLPRGWQAAIARCLERDEVRRPAGASDVVGWLEGTGRRIRPGYRRRTAFGVLAASLVGVVSIALLGRTPGGTNAAVMTPRSVAILPLAGDGRSDGAWMSTALSELVGAELEAAEGFNVIPGDVVAEVAADAADGRELSARAAVRLGSILGADTIVTVSRSGGSSTAPTADVRVMDTLHGDVQLATRVGGGPSSFQARALQVGRDLRAKLGAHPLSSEEARLAVAPFSRNLMALEAYSEGLRRLRDLDPPGACEMLGKAVVADPSFALAHSVLAMTWEDLGYERRAREAADKAFALSSALPRRDRLVLEQRYRVTHREWAAAIDVGSALFTFHPERLDYGLDLATAQVRGFRATDALRTLDRLRALASGDARVDLLEASAWGARRDFVRMESAATRAVSVARSHGRRILLAQSLLARSDARRALGRSFEALDDAEEARGLYVAVGHRKGEVDGLLAAAAALGAQGDVSGASDLLGSARVICHQIDYRRAESKILNTVATLRIWQAGAEVEAPLTEAIQIAQATGNLSGEATSLTNLGYYLMRRDPGKAQGLLQRAQAIYRDVGAKADEADLVRIQGEVASTQNDLEGAERIYGESIALFLDVGIDGCMGIPVTSLGFIMVKRGRLPEAQWLFEAARALSEEDQDAYGRVRALRGIAQIAVVEGRADAARDALGLALNAAREACLVDDEAAALGDLGRAALQAGCFDEAGRLFRQCNAVAVSEWPKVTPETFALLALCQGRPDEAEWLLAPAAQAHGMTPRQAVMWGRVMVELGRDGDAEAALQEAAPHRAELWEVGGFSFAVVSAAAAARRNVPSAERKLDSLQREAAGLGFVEASMDARLVRGQIFLRYGAAGRGRAELRELEREARQRGLDGVAEVASRSLIPSPLARPF